MPFLREFRDLNRISKNRGKDDTAKVPDPTWVCGRRGLGTVCETGPSRRGKCRGSFMCRPNEVNGFWHCSRPLDMGGPCKHGPTAEGGCGNTEAACRPTYSMPARRSFISRWVALGVAGLAILGLTYGSHTKYLMPGPLNASHSLQTNCRTCHANISAGQFGWLKAVVTFADPKKESATCLACHETGGEKASPHDLALQELEKITERRKLQTTKSSPTIASRISSTILPVGFSIDDGIYCATCHQEHQGHNFDLKRMSDERCQTCHVFQYKNYYKRHPEFGSYPYKRRTRIIFDHSSHFGKHFPEWIKKHPEDKTVPNVCTNCHGIETDKRLMSVKSFKAVCSSCHLNEIIGKERASGPKGIAFLTLPGLDLDTLKEKGKKIGKWPEESEAEITPFMVMLIGSDANRKKILRIVSELDLLDLSEANDIELSAVEQFVWELKALLHEFSTTKASEITKRLSRTTGFNVGTGLASKLVATIPRDVLLSAQKEWLPSLTEEIADRPPATNVFWSTTVSGDEKKSEPSQPNDPAKPAVETPEKKRRAPQQQNSQTAPEFRANQRSNLLPAQQAEKLDFLQKGTGGARQLVQVVPTEPIEAKESWRVDPYGNLLKGNEKSVPPGQDDEGGEDEDSADADSEVEESEDDDADVSDSEDADSEVDLEGEEEESAESADGGEGGERAARAVDAEAWAEFGGWYRRDYSILYKPTGHADSFLRAWLEFSGKLHEPKNNGPAAVLFELLTDKDAQGQCVKCHSVDQGARETRKIKWGTSTLADKRARFTIFLHEPHFGSLDKRGCLTCHEINDNAKYLNSYKTPDPKEFVSNFHPMKMKQCITCHRRRAARQDCTLCHKYHINEVKSPIVKTKVPKK